MHFFGISCLPSRQRELVTGDPSEAERTVDTCEEEKVYADRIRDQAEYFGGLSDEQTKALGRTAT